MLVGLLLTLNIVVCLALIGVVLLQRSEGGALGGGGSPTGLVTTRGAGDLLTRATWVLFALFLSLSLALTLVGGRERSSQAIINRLKLQSINPDAPVRRPPPAPGEATPPPVQEPAASSPSLSPSSGLSAPKPTIRSQITAPPPSSGPADFATPAPSVSLPPLPTATKPPKP